MGLTSTASRLIKKHGQAATLLRPLPPIDDGFGMAALMADLLEKPDEFHHQGDETGEPVDFFTPVHASEALHPDFLTVATEGVFSPARGIIEPMMRWHEDLDGNFVEQFQSTAFDQRIWELYLFATLTELGFSLDADHAVPDFIGRSLNQVLARCIFTSGTTLAALLPMAIWGGPAVAGFAWPLIAGVVIATASSLFVAGPVLAWLAARSQRTMSAATIKSENQDIQAGE